MEKITNDFVMQKVKEGRRYTLVFLKAGPKADVPEAQAHSIKMAHVQYLFEQVQEGRLLVNGPLLDDPVLKGLSIYQSEDQEEVRRWVEQDPAVQAGFFSYELRFWFSVPGWGMPTQ
jgi:uncharacterized protein YciI